MMHIISTGVLALLAIGILLRKKRRIHGKIMTAAFVIDLASVLYIEVTAHAVERVVRELTPLLIFHAAISTLTLVLYVRMIMLGVKILHGKRTLLPRHRRMAVAFCILRLINYATSYLV